LKFIFVQALKFQLVKVLIKEGSTVRWFGSAIQIPCRSVISWETIVQ